jgi:hypothetical protein
MQRSATSKMKIEFPSGSMIWLRYMMSVETLRMSTSPTVSLWSAAPPAGFQPFRTCLMAGSGNEVKWVSWAWFMVTTVGTGPGPA